MQEAGIRPGAAALFTPFDYPQCFDLPLRYSAVSWHEHIPFAFALVPMLQPRLLVELGVHKGDSYLAFCEAVQKTGVACQCRGVDTWRGDAHAGYYGDEVLTALRAYHDPLYGSFSTLMQASFDQAAVRFEDGSVDLLHIDGLHTYDAVKHDWETWRSKVSSRGIVLFHDTQVREHGFGVWQLWEEVARQHPSFEFRHGFGLGVLVVGNDAPESVRALAQLPPVQRNLVQAHFQALGDRLTQRAKAATSAEALHNLQLTQQVGEFEAKIREYHTACTGKDAEIARLQQMQSKVEAQAKQLEAQAKELEAMHAKLAQYHEALMAKDASMARLCEELGRHHASSAEKDLAIARLQAAGPLKDQEIESLRGKLLALDTELSLATGKMAQLAVKSRADAAAVVAADARERDLNAHLARVYSGASFRAGRLLTAPARWLLHKP